MAPLRSLWKALAGSSASEHAGCLIQNALIGALLGPFLMLAVNFASGSERPPYVPDSPVLTSSRSFAVGGASSTENLDLAVWADEVYQRYGRLTGRTPSLHTANPVIISVVANSDITHGRVRRLQRLDGGALYQELRIDNPALVDHEDVLEGIIWLSLNRRIYEGQSGVNPAVRIVEVPDWFAVGVAQNLYPELKQRNLLAVKADWEKDDFPELEELLSLEYLPNGRRPQKFLVGVLFSWIMDEAGSEDVVRRILALIASDVRLDENWILQFIPSESDPFVEWDLWFARKTADAAHMRPLNEADVTALAQLIGLDSQRWKYMYRGINPAGSLTDLIEHRGEEWTRILAVALRVELRGLMPGRSQAFRDVVGAYLVFLDGVTEEKLLADRKLHELLRHSDRRFTEFRGEFYHERIGDGSGFGDAP